MHLCTQVACMIMTRMVAYELAHIRGQPVYYTSVK